VASSTTGFSIKFEENGITDGGEEKIVARRVFHEAASSAGVVYCRMK